MIPPFLTRALLVISAVQFLEGKVAGGDTSRPPGVVFNKNWDSPMQSGALTRQDLKDLLGWARDPSDIDFGPAPDLEIYCGVTYLMPFKEACAKLQVSGQVTSRVQVACPGFPKASCYFVPFRGRFGGFNYLYLILDAADQVIAVQLVQENPSYHGLPSSARRDWTTYNFINYRVNGSSSNVISHERIEIGKTTRIRSGLYSQKQGKCLELVELYLPRPMVRFIRSTLGHAELQKRSTTKGR